MGASFNGNPCTVIASCYSSNNAGDETDNIVFNNKLSSIVRHITKQNFQIISGDMNAYKGKDGNRFGFFVLMAYQLFLGYLMPKPFS